MKKLKRINKDVVRRRAVDHSVGFGSTYLQLPEGLELFKPKAGVVEFDILPYTINDPSQNPIARKYKLEAGDLYYERTFFTHRGIGPDNSTVLCLAKTANKSCPICELRNELSQSQSYDEKTVKNLAPKERQLFCIKEFESKKLYIWDVSYYLFGERLDKEILTADEDEEIDLFADLEAGQRLRCLIAEQKRFSSTYVECEAIRFRQRKQPLSESILSDVPDLDALLVIPTYESLRSLLMGDAAVASHDSQDEEEEEFGADGLDDFDDEDEQPAPRKRRPPVEEDDDEDEQPAPRKRRPPVEEDDDEEPTPRKRRTPVEEEDDEDEDEQPAPRKRRPPVEEEDDFDTAIDAVRGESTKRVRRDVDDVDHSTPTKRKRRAGLDADGKIIPFDKASGKTGTVPDKIKCPVKADGFGKRYGEFSECDSCRVHSRCMRETLQG